MIRSTKGSIWHRWDPHIHTPGTVLEDKYPKDQRDPTNRTAAWDGFFQHLLNCQPAIRAVGITDYCTLSSFRTFLSKARERNVGPLVYAFANVELRYSIRTEKGSGVNVHLLFNIPEEAAIDEAERFLGTLPCAGRGDIYCTNADLMRLGKSYRRDSTLTGFSGQIEIE